MIEYDLPLGEKCPVCFGNGFLVKWDNEGRTQYPCLKCNGEGYIPGPELELDYETK